MKTSKPIILYLPDLLIKDLNKYLKDNPPKFKFQLMHFYYIVHHITTMQIQYKNDEFFNLNMNHLKSVTASNINRYIKILKDGRFIISDKSYEIGVKSLKYKLNPSFIKGISKIELKQDSKLSKKIVKKLRQRKAHYNRLQPHLKIMYKDFMKMELDYDKAYEWIEKNATNDAQKLNYLTSIDHIKDKRFRYFKRNKTNKRLDTNLTNLKSELKQFIIGNYVSIDLKNSQPFLLGILLNYIFNNKVTLCYYIHNKTLIETFGIKRIKAVSKFHQNQEKAKMVNLRLFHNSVLNGNLYDGFIKHYSNDITRKEVKNIMFKVLFSRNYFYKDYRKIIPYEKEKKIFASVYPFVYEVVKILKTKNHKTLPIYLQNLESFLFIDCIAKELVENGITPKTIHDSVIVKTKDQAKTIEIINKVFMEQIEIIPSFEIKNLKNSQIS